MMRLRGQHELCLEAEGTRVPIFSALQRQGILRKAMELCIRACKFVQTKGRLQSNPKRLQLAETISLGDRRFVAVVQVDNCRFLIGGGTTSVTLLAKLSAADHVVQLRKHLGCHHPIAVQKGGSA